MSVRTVYVIHAALAAVAVAAFAIGFVWWLGAAFAVAAVIVAGEIAVALVLTLRARGIAQRYADAAALVDQAADTAGDTAAAAALDALCAESRLIPSMHAMILQKRATQLMNGGDLSEAKAILLELLAAGWFNRKKSVLYLLMPAVCGDLAIIHAFTGDGTTSAVWRDRAHAAVSDARRGTLVFMESLLLMRASLYSEAAKHLAEVGAAGRVSPPRARLLRWVVAYAVTHGEPAVADASLVAARTSTREVVALAAYLPELATFVRNHAQART